MIEYPERTNYKVAVIVFNLGGPATLNDVEDFLFNLFFDKRIITVNTPVRFLIAKLISKIRNKKAQEIYKLIGGGSPILQNTLSQATALQSKLIANCSSILGDSINWRVFCAMRHSEPRLSNVLNDINDFCPSKLILLPLYPQYSTTTTESFFDEFKDKMHYLKMSTKVLPIYDYHDNKYYINACVNKIKDSIDLNKINFNTTRLLFSAHGLPQSIVKNGDPYEKQVNESARLIKDSLEKLYKTTIDAKICYQSKVGPAKWLTPSLEEEFKLAAQHNKDILLFPISFVSEHSETLAELDIEYREIANELGIKNYFRINTLADMDDYILCLADICKETIILNHGK